MPRRERSVYTYISMSLLFSKKLSILGNVLFLRSKTFAPQLSQATMAFFRDESSVVTVRVAVLWEIRCLQTFSTFGCMED